MTATEERCVRQQELKHQLLAAMQEAEIEAIEVDYNGEGDQGMVDECRCYWQGEEVDLLGDGGPLYQNLYQAAEELLFAVLPDGWEYGSGSMGTMHVERDAQSVRIEHSHRVIAYEVENFNF